LTDPDLPNVGRYLPAAGEHLWKTEAVDRQVKPALDTVVRLVSYALARPGRS
jgi:hypothetical protein